LKDPEPHENTKIYRYNWYFPPPRIVPGQYLAIDPKGRAVMIGAIEKQKLVYILNRDAQVQYLSYIFHFIWGVEKEETFR
jgi:hypothetical protein